MVNTKDLDYSSPQILCNFEKLLKSKGPEKKANLNNKFGQKWPDIKRRESKIMSLVTNGRNPVEIPKNSIYVSSVGSYKNMF